MVKEDKPKVEGGAKPKVSRFQQSTSTRKASFKSPTIRLEYKVFNFGKQKHSVDFVNNSKEISMHIKVNYINGGPEISMAIKKMEIPMINVPEVPEDTSSRIEILFQRRSTNKLK